MLATGLRALQLLLVIAAAYLIWATVSPLVSATPVTEVELRELAPSEQPDRSFTRYAVVSERNLFKVREAALPPGPVVEEEVLEESKARARLLATAVTSRPELSLAVIEELANRERTVKRAGEQVAGLEIVRIERRRLVVRNGDQLEQISLEDSVQPSTTAATTRDRSREAQLAARRAAARSRARARARRPTPQRAPDPQALDLGALMSSNALALNPGEQVESVNGIRFDDTASVDQLMEAMAQPGTKVLSVIDATGARREITLELP